MALSQGVFSLKGVVQNYSWGGFDFLPSLLGIDNDNKKPFAEYWLGAHPSHSSFIRETGENLADQIEKDKQQLLGNSVAGRYGTLPFLFKVLDVRQMLSIQVHPDIMGAIKGFDEENEKGIPVTASNRNYRDRNHKPELMVALSDFWLLHGFKNERSVSGILAGIAELNFLRNIFETHGYKAMYEKIMLMPQDEVNHHLEPLLKRVIPKYQNHELKKDQEDFWAARAALNFCRDGQYDRGIFSIYLFNLLHLKKGEGIFQQAGLPHAYLEGQNVEVMANSDNVLRAGLTDKHIDVAELMKHVKFEATIPSVIYKDNDCHTLYHSPAAEFELHHYQLKEGQEENFHTASAEIILVLEGNVDILCRNLKKAGRGEAFLVLPHNAVKLKSNTVSSLFRVTVPVVEN